LNVGFFIASRMWAFLVIALYTSSRGKVINQIRFSLKTKIASWNPFLCAGPQLAVNVFWKIQKIEQDGVRGCQSDVTQDKFIQFLMQFKGKSRPCTGERLSLSYLSFLSYYVTNSHQWRSQKLEILERNRDRYSNIWVILLIWKNLYWIHSILLIYQKRGRGFLSPFLIHRDFFS